MKAIVTRRNDDGSYDNVGTDNRIVVSGLKTKRGILKRARNFANGRSFRVELFTDHDWYRAPFNTFYNAPFDTTVYIANNRE